jgi:hypothetical protein
MMLLSISSLLVVLMMCALVRGFGPVGRISRRQPLAIEMKNFPVKIRNIVTKMKDATQKALKSKLSRIEVELPPAADYGVEKGGIFDNLPELEKVKRSNREAARLFTEMFSMLSSTTVCMFTTEGEARNAKTSYGGAFRGQCLSIDGGGKGTKGFSNLRSRRFTAEEQEAALLGSDGVYVPDGTEVLVVVGPRAKDFKKIKKMHEKLGEGTLIILLNARVDAVELLAGKEEGELAWLREAFTPVFTYAPPVLVNAQGEAEEQPNMLQYHEFGPEERWYIAEINTKAGFGGRGGQTDANVFENLAAGFTGSSFKVLVETKDRLTPRELSVALDERSLEK